MRSIRYVLCWFTSVMILILCCSSSAHADKGAEGQLRKMISMNSLDGEGKAPFHIKIAFQYYGLDGKPVESGTVEEWWAGPNSYRIAVNSPSFTEVFPSPEAETPEVKSREAYVIHELLDAAIHPFPRYTNFDGLDVRAGKRSADGAALSCVLVEAFNSKGPFLASPTFCVEPKTNALRLRENLYASSIARNTIGVFHDVNVALDYQISYGRMLMDKMAISGHVTALQTFDPATSTLPLGPPLADRIDANSIPEFFVKGILLFQTIKNFPSFAVKAFPNATVAVRGLITKDGSVTGVVVMSSPDAAFSESAIESVRLWKYKPYIVGENHIEVYANFFILYGSSSDTNTVRRPN